MIPALFPTFVCPTCGAKLKKLPRTEMTGGDWLWCLIGDWPFWILFGLCITFGMWKPIAGIVAVAVTIYLYYLWDRSQSQYACAGCDKSFPYSSVRPRERA